MDAGQVLGVALVAHGGADTGVHGQGDGTGGPDPVRHAPSVLTLLALGAVRVEGSHHVLGTAAFGLPERKISQHIKLN